MSINCDIDVSSLLSPYFKEISQLNEELRQKDILLEFYSKKTKKLKEEIEKKRVLLEKEEDELSRQFITTVESEDFFINPNEETIELVRKVKEKKEKMNKEKGKLLQNKKELETKQKALNNQISELSYDKQLLYKIITNIIINNESIDSYANNEECNGVIKENIGLIRTIIAKYKKNFNISNDNSDINQRYKVCSNNSELSISTLNKNKETLSSNNKTTQPNNQIKKNNSYSRGNVYYSPIKKKNNQYQDTSFSIRNFSPITMKSYENVGPLNKSFYLLRNAAIEKSLNDKREITQEDLGGNEGCYKLLRNYRNEINTQSKKKRKTRSSSFERTNGLNGNYLQQRQEIKKKITPKIKIRGKLVNQNVIGQATDTENGVIDSQLFSDI